MDYTIDNDIQWWFLLTVLILFLSYYRNDRMKSMYNYTHVFVSDFVNNFTRLYYFISIKLSSNFR